MDSASGCEPHVRWHHVGVANSGSRGDTYPLALFAIGYETRVSLQSHLFDTRAALGRASPSLPASAALADFV